RAQVVASEEHAVLPAQGEVTTVVDRNLGGLSIAVYTVVGGLTQLVAEGFATTLELGGAPAQLQGVSAVPESEDSPADFANDDIQAVRWDPATETVEERLATIVSESMGYDVSDLPRDRKSTRLNSSHVSISYAVFCLKKKKRHTVKYVRCA